ncbi:MULTISPECIES: hypothetical protein [Lysobacter]|uniref:hypothetical protein n=1 Tax=Lysobacter TaxID=68 RepID=UPI000896BFD3|nr:MULTISPECIES: hypothetical protein [Lysobacter]ATE70764.1 hypothetical protein CNO08_04940 [Lysobacter capsici]SDW84940.1 hypothetical protein SAMN05421681_10312 [Lysobacter enzymogenes]
MPTYTLRYELYFLNTCEFEVKANTIDEAIAAAKEIEPKSQGNWRGQSDTTTKPRLQSVRNKNGVELVCVDNPFYVPRGELEACLTDQWGRDPELAHPDKHWVAEIRRHMAMWERVAPEITKEGRAHMKRDAKRLCRGRKKGKGGR